MIVFIAPFPKLSDERDGYIQRIASIDALVSDEPRIYLDISFRRFWVVRKYEFGKALVLQLNALRHFSLISSLYKSASKIYVHSIYNSLKALPAYWLGRTITDLHGVVPEELAHAGKRWYAGLYNLVERIVLRRSEEIIYVTNTMRRHFEVKYGRASPLDRTIAIIPKINDGRGNRENVLHTERDPQAVIYAGGLQPWQNVPMMIEAATHITKNKYIFLSGSAETLRKLAGEAGVENYVCESVAPELVPDYYLKCTFGFILRNPIVVNKVACPTKLVEYLHWGVIPIVLSRDIGDFATLGVKYVSIEDYRIGRMPSAADIANFRAVNRRIVDNLIKTCEDQLSALAHALRAT